MATIDLTMLIARLNDASRRGLEASAGSALSRTHYNVEVEHWLLQLMEKPGSDVAHIARAFDIDPGRAGAHLAASLDPHASPHFVSMAERVEGLAPVRAGSPDRPAVTGG